ncbi:MAG: hypothetical protein DMF30_10850, partial [Verrucomicrobia bacterium]
MIPCRRFSIAFVALSLFANTTRLASAAEAFIILDSQTGYVLQAQEAKKKHQIGSLTKIATAVVVLDWAEHKAGNLNQI